MDDFGHVCGTCGKGSMSLPQLKAHACAKPSAAPWPHEIEAAKQRWPSRYKSREGKAIARRGWEACTDEFEALLSQAIAERDAAQEMARRWENSAKKMGPFLIKYKEALESIADGDRVVLTAPSLNQITRFSRQDMIAIASLALADGCAEGGNNG